MKKSEEEKCYIIFNKLEELEKQVEKSKKYIRIFKESIQNPSSIKTSKEDYDNFQRMLTNNNEALENFISNANKNIEALDTIFDEIAEVYYKD